MQPLESKNNQPSTFGEAAIAFDRVTVSLEGVSILDGVSASVPRGGSTAVVGPNGAGKTTLLLALLGQVPHTGTIRVASVAGGGAPRIGYVPQRLQFDRGLPLTVMDFLVMGRQRRPLWLGSGLRLRVEVRSLLESVRSEPLAGRMLGALSGGELQRVLLALALQQEPDLLVLDEPSAGVDVQGGIVFCELLERLRRERGFTQLMVSHDLAMVTHHATHTILLNRSFVAEGPPRDVLTPRNLSAVFGLHMGLVDARSMPNGQAACSCERHLEANP